MSDSIATGSFDNELRSLSPEQQSSCGSMSPEPSASSPASSTVKQETETKPVKKRKSWGQQLPTPTTNLPPRKRAKTAEEKEQRRVERVLRNRAAAQKSREIKKQQLEAIERERDSLKATLEEVQQMNRKLLEEIQMLRARYGVGAPCALPSPALTPVKEEIDMLSPRSLVSDEPDRTVDDIFSPKSDASAESFHIDPQQLQSSDSLDFDFQGPNSPVSSPREAEDSNLSFHFDMLGGVDTAFEHNIFTETTTLDFTPDSAFDDFIHLQADESDLIQASTYNDENHLIAPTLAH